MVCTWYLSYHLDRDQAPSVEVLTAALDRVFDPPLVLARDAWSGNPRDFYGRWLRGVGQCGEISVRSDIALEHTMDPTLPPDVIDTSRVSVMLDGSAAVALDMDALWGRLTTAMETLGYRDDTLSGPSAKITSLLAAAGARERVEALRAASTRALIEKFRRGPAHWPLVASWNSADDLDGALRSALDPAQVKSVSINQCDLEALPSVLLENPVFFPALEYVDLSGNRLTSIPTLKDSYPQLKWLNVSGNPMPPLLAAEWPGVRIIDGRS